MRPRPERYKRRGAFRWLALGALGAWSGVWAIACGSRTGLPGDFFANEESPDGAPALHDANVFDVIANMFDARPPPGFDATPPPPPGFDAEPPRFDAEPPFDARRPIDARPPPIDAVVTMPDVFRNDCPDASATLIYVITSENVLYSFYPPDLAFKQIGTIACPSAPGTTPFSMAVDRVGKAYVVFTDGNLYRVSTSSAACIGSPFTPNQQGFNVFGMGFVSDTNGPQETLYVAQDPALGVNSLGLATIDTTTFQLNVVGPWSPPIPRGELTGTGDGRLFGFYTNQTGTGSHIVQIDKSNANVVGDDPLAIGTPASAFAFAFWGGDFYVFTSPGGTSTVTRYSPSDNASTNITTLAGTIVGAGVSTCAPE